MSNESDIKFKSKINKVDFLNTSSIMYSDDVFVLIKKDKKLDGNVKITYLISPANDENRICFKKFYFGK